MLKLHLIEIKSVLTLAIRGSEPSSIRNVRCHNQSKLKHEGFFLIQSFLALLDLGCRNLDPTRDGSKNKDFAASCSSSFLYPTIVPCHFSFALKT